MTEVDEGLIKIISEELGKNSAELFIKFYRGFPKKEQVRGVQEVLKLTIGEPRTNHLLKKIDINE